VSTNMKRFTGMSGLGVSLVLGLLVGAVVAQDWPQWRGPNRDGKIVSSGSGFKVPATWPKELARQWKTEVGDGVSTPALVAGKLYVFSRQGDDEVIRCLDAATGKEVWADKYASPPASGPASRFPGPRSSPAVLDGKVVTLGVVGIVSCLDAATGKVLWRKDDYQGLAPQFFASSSPLLVDGMCLAQVGGGGRGRSSGGMIAYDLSTGEKKWEWKGDAPAYGSPMLMDVSGERVVVMPTANKMVALRVSDGRERWGVNYSQGRYNAATPIVAGDTLIYAGPTRGITAEKLQAQGDSLDGTTVWTNVDQSVIYNTPVIKDGLLYGISTEGALFCVHQDSGKSAWSAPLADNPAAGDASGRGEAAAATGTTARPASSTAQSQEKGPAKRGGGRGGMGGTSGYGSVVDAGAVLLALTPAGQLVVFAPSAAEFKPLARLKVATDGTYAHPVASGSQIFIKDRDSVSLYLIP
jgi:outer membrane protein assembly factor BamB